jgi:hypothetical protein
MATTQWLINSNAALVPRSVEDATEVIGVDHISADGTLTPDLIAVKWGAKLTFRLGESERAALFALVVARTAFSVRDELGTTRTCVIPLGRYRQTRIHRGALAPRFDIEITVRQQ